MSHRVTKILLAITVLLALPLSAVKADPKYGAGLYGRCTYSSCGITMTTTGLVNLDVAPTGGGRCTVASDNVSVLTHNSAGFTLKVNNSTTNTSLVVGSQAIPASTGTPASPVTLSNSWGFRVDGLSAMGAGPTSAASNAAPSGLTFAGIPASDATPVTVATTGVYADAAVVVPVWLAVCADTSVVSGTYSTTITYTAITN